MVTVYPPEALLPCLHHFWALSVCGTLGGSLLPSCRRERIPFPREWVLVHEHQRRNSLSVAVPSSEVSWWWRGAGRLGCPTFPGDLHLEPACQEGCVAPEETWEKREQRNQEI